MKNLIIIAVFFLIMISCKKEAQHFHDEVTINEEKNSNVYNLLKNSLNKDSIELQSWKPFYYLKTGYFLSDKEKNALLIKPDKDSLFTIEIYSQNGEVWVKDDALENFDLHPIQLATSFNDYNFDKKNDIYIQFAVSNGYAVSYGHLITINPQNKKMSVHPEAEELGNMKVDSIKEIIISEQWQTCLTNDYVGPCLITNKWTNGKIIFIDKVCPECK